MAVTDGAVAGMMPQGAALDPLSEPGDVSPGLTVEMPRRNTVRLELPSATRREATPSGSDPILRAALVATSPVLRSPDAAPEAGVPRSPAPARRAGCPAWTNPERLPTRPGRSRLSRRASPRR